MRSNKAIVGCLRVRRWVWALTLAMVLVLSASGASAAQFALGLGTADVELEDPGAAGAEAARQAREALKGEEARVVLLFTALPIVKKLPEVSYPDAVKLVGGVARVFQKDRIFGCDFYGVFHRGGKSYASVAVLALGGDALRVRVAHAPCFHWMGAFEKSEDVHGLPVTEKWARLLALNTRQKAARTEGLLHVGRTIARDLGDVDRQNSLLLLIGDMHVESNAKVMAGVQEVLGAAFPIIGGASPPEYACYVAGEMRPATVMGILITMPMKVSALLDRPDKAESKGWSDQEWIDSGTVPLKKILEDAGGSPPLVFMFDCRSRARATRLYFPELLELVPPETALFGFQGSGENGPKQPGGESVGTSEAVVFCAVQPTPDEP